MHSDLPLAGKRVAILLDELYEDAELTVPRDVLTRAGAQVVLIAPFAGRTYTGKKGDRAISDRAAAGTQAADFDALVIPGGYAPDRMRLRHAMVDLTKAIAAAGKPVAAICHGPQMLISAGLLRGRTVTCWPSIAIDVTNAGGLYVDRPVVTDGNLITSRKPDDVPQFTAALIGALEA